MITINEIDSAVTKISDTINGIGSAIVPYSTSINSAATKIMSNVSLFNTIENLQPLRIGLTVINLVTSVISAVANELGIKSTDDACTLGLKAKYAEKQPEEFLSKQDYITYLNEEVTIPEGVEGQLTETERAGYSLAGSALTLGALNEKFGLIDDIDFDVFIFAERLSLTVTEIVSLVKGFVDSAIPVSTFEKYISNDEELGFDKMSDIQDVVFQSFESADPSLSKDDISEKISAMREAL